MVCPSCGSEIAPNVQFCTQCGTKFTQIKKRFCLHCGAELEENAIFCGMCGMRIEEPSFGEDSLVLIGTNAEISQLSCDTTGKVEEDDLSWIIEADEEFQRTLTKTVYDENNADDKDTENTKGSTGNISLIGIIGAIIILIGEFLPIVSISAFVTTLDVSFYEAVGTTYNSLIAFLALLIPIAIIALYIFRKWRIATLLVWIASFFYTYQIAEFMKDYILDTYFFEIVGVGFWIILLGFILSMLTPFLEGINNKLLAFIRRK